MNVLERRRNLRQVVVAIAGIIFLFVMFRWFEQSQLYHPTRELETGGDALRRPFEDVHFKAGDGIGLHGWFFPADTNSPRANLVFLICHGNGGNISHRLDLCAVLLQTGANVFVFDYRGYGRSEGKPGEEGTYLDAQAAYHWLCQKGFCGEHIIAFGESLGGGVASELALREKLGGIVLQSTFTSVPDIGAELFPWLPVRCSAPSIRHTRQTAAHPCAGTGDAWLRGWFGAVSSRQENFAAANEPKLFCELRGDHNDALWDEPEFRTAMEKFLKMVEQSSSNVH